VGSGTIATPTAPPNGRPRQYGKTSSILPSLLASAYPVEGLGLPVAAIHTALIITATASGRPANINAGARTRLAKQNARRCVSDRKSRITQASEAAGTHR